jgi:hypothetical protein
MEDAVIYPGDEQPINKAQPLASDAQKSEHPHRRNSMVITRKTGLAAKSSKASHPQGFLNKV